jgi:hypothetical protein
VISIVVPHIPEPVVDRPGVSLMTSAMSSRVTPLSLALSIAAVSRRAPLADVPDLGPDLQALRVAADVHGEGKAVSIVVRCSPR